MDEAEYVEGAKELAIETDQRESYIPSPKFAIPKFSHSESL